MVGNSLRLRSFECHLKAERICHTHSTLLLLLWLATPDGGTIANVGIFATASRQAHHEESHWPTHVLVSARYPYIVWGKYCTIWTNSRRVQSKQETQILASPVVGRTFPRIYASSFILIDWCHFFLWLGPTFLFCSRFCGYTRVVFASRTTDLDVIFNKRYYIIFSLFPVFRYFLVFSSSPRNSARMALLLFPISRHSASEKQTSSILYMDSVSHSPPATVKEI